MKKLLLLLSIIFVFNTNAQVYYQLYQASATTQDSEVIAGDSITVNVFATIVLTSAKPAADSFYLYYDPSAAFISTKKVFSIKIDSLYKIPQNQNGSRTIKIKIGDFSYYGDGAIIGFTNINIPLKIINPTPPVTSILSPISSDQKDGIVYYYNYSGELISTAQTKEKPKISEGLYIFKIDYVDGTYGSGKIMLP